MKRWKYYMGVDLEDAHAAFQIMTANVTLHIIVYAKFE